MAARYNIRYGRSTAADEEVENAARVADIHDRILSFPDGTCDMLLHCAVCKHGTSWWQVSVRPSVHHTRVLY